MKKCTIFLITGIIAFTVAAAIAFSFFHCHKRMLVKTISSADRIEIQTSAFQYDYPGKCLLEIKGHDKVMEFINMLNIDEKNFHSPCECDGDFRIAFFIGKTNLATIAIKHGFGVEWFKGKWPGQTGLTKESKENIFKWLKQEGFVSYSREDELNKKP